MSEIIQYLKKECEKGCQENARQLILKSQSLTCDFLAISSWIFMQQK